MLLFSFLLQWIISGINLVTLTEELVKRSLCWGFKLISISSEYDTSVKLLIFSLQGLVCCTTRRWEWKIVMRGCRRNVRHNSLARYHGVIWIYINKPTPWLMKPGGSMSHLKGLSNNSYPEPNQPNSTHWYLISWRPILILSSQVCLGLP